MKDTEKRKLQGILRKIDALRNEIEELVGSEEISTKKPKTSQDVKELIESMNVLSSVELESRLKNLGHKELGEVFITVGGSSSDKRKPKAWLIERILWLAKEFSEGHRSIRES